MSAKVVYDYHGGVVKHRGYSTTHINGKFQLKVHAEIRWLPVEDLHSLRCAPADVPLVEFIGHFRFCQDHAIK